MVNKLKAPLCLFVLFCCVGAWPSSGSVAPTPASQTITPVSSNQSAPTIGGAVWRDQEVTTGWFGKGEINIRRAGTNGGEFAQDGLYLSVGVGGGGGVRMGIVSGGTNYGTFVETNPSGCITNWPSSGSHTFTFGVKGFTVYFKIDGTLAVDTCTVGGTSTGTSSANTTGTMAYYEYRAGSFQSGQASMWIQAGGTNTFTVNYFTNKHLFSNYASNTFDLRDFGSPIYDNGVRQVAAVTGTMSGSSTTLNLSGPADFRVGDQIIVEIGGESGGGARETTGVGGTMPVLNYANATAMNADTSQPANTIAYLQSTGQTYIWNKSSSGAWQQISTLSASYYAVAYIPYPLIARVTAIGSMVGGLPTVLTLDTASSAATTNANVYLDALPGFVPVAQNPPQYFQDSRDDNCPCDTYTNMSFSIPTGTWYLSHRVTMFEAAGGGRTGLAVYGQGASGVNKTTIWHPHGVEGSFLVLQTNDNLFMHDYFEQGNVGDNKFGLDQVLTTGSPLAKANSNRNWNFSFYGEGMQGSVNNNSTAQNISCLDVFSGCAQIQGGANALINNVSSQMDTIVRDYTGWQIQVADCTGNSGITNSTLTGKYGLQGFEMFSCNGTPHITNSGGTNAMYSTNSTSNWTIDFQTATDTITANAFGTEASHGIDDAIINVNDNAFGSGNTGLINNPNIIEQGYVTNSANENTTNGNSFNDSWKFIHIQSAQTGVTIQGQYPGGGGCSSSLGGYMQAPNFDAATNEYGPVILSDAANTVVTGIRIVGAAITTPGRNSHIGNISLLGATSNATNNVADVVNATGTVSGNETNATYCGAFSPPSPPSTAYRGTGDIATGGGTPTATAWWGVRAFSQWQVTGTYVAMNLVRTSDGHACDVLINTSGGLGNTTNCLASGGFSAPGDNGTAVASWCNATTCEVAELYDQSAIFNSNIAFNAAQPTLSNAPTLGFGSSGCVESVTVCVVFNGSTSQLNAWEINTSATALSVSAAALATTTSGSPFLIVYNSNNQFALYDSNTQAFILGSSLGILSGTAPTNNENAINAALSASANGNVNGVATSLGSNLPNSGTKVIQLGFGSGGGGLPGNILESGIWNGTALTPANENSTCQNQQAYYGVGNFGAAC